MADAPLVQPQAFTADGQPIPPEQVPEAIASGKAFFEQGTKVLARTANGRLVTVAPEEAAHPGIRVLSADELAAVNERRVYGKGFANEAKAFGAGAARTLTLGGSDVAARAIGGADTAQTLDALRRQNPISNTAGEVTGMAVPLLASGGSAAAAEGAESGGLLGAAVDVASAPLNAVSELGGAVSGVVGSGLKAAGVGTSLLGRTAARAISLGASGAAEGAVFGAGQTLSESALKGDPLTAEAIAAGMGHGALFGGVLGAGVGAASELGAAALGKLPASEKLDEMATGFARKQLGRDFEKVGKNASRETAEAWKNADAETLLDHKLQNGPNAGKTVFEASTKPQDIADNLRYMADDFGSAIGKARDRAAAIIEENPAAAPDIEKLLADGDELVKGLRKQGVSGAMSQARAAERELKLLRQKIESLGGAAPEASGTGFGEAASLANAAAKESGEVEQLDKFLNQNRRSVSEAERSGAANETSSGVNKFLRSAQEKGAVYDGLVYRGTNEAELEQLTKTGRVSHTLSVSRDIEGAGHFAKKGGVLLEIKDHPVPVDGIDGSNTYSEALIPKDSPAKVIGERMEGDTRVVTIQMQAPGPKLPVSPADAYRAVTEWHRSLEQQLNPAGVPKSMLPMAVKNKAALDSVSSLVNNFLKDSTAQALTVAGEDGSIVAKLHQQYAGALAMRKAAEKEAQRVASNRRVSLTDHMLGIGAGLTAMASGNLGALPTMALGGAAAIGNKMAREQGNAVLAQIARRAARMTAVVDSAAKALAGAGAKALPSATRLALEVERPVPYEPRSQTELASNFAQVRTRLQELQSPQHQQAQLAHATAKIQTEYPEIATALTQQMVRAQAYLTSQLPEQRGASVISPMARPTTVPPREMQRFLSKVNAVMEPESVLAKIAKGMLDDDEIHAIEQVYPKTFESLQKAAINELASKREELPYSSIIHVSRVLKIQGDSSLGARFLSIQSAIQTMDKALMQSSQPGGGPPIPRLKGPPLQPGESMTLPSSHAPGHR